MTDTAVAVALGRIEENVSHVREGQKKAEAKLDTVIAQMGSVKVEVAEVKSSVASAHHRIDETRKEIENDRAVQSQRRTPWTALAAFLIAGVSLVVNFGDRFWGAP